MPSDRYPTFEAKKATYPPKALRNNAEGNDFNDFNKEALERFKIRELCEGWGIYRDAAEWVAEFPLMFFGDAYITTSWTEGSVDEFIQTSKDGLALGSSFMYIGHRISGSSVETNPELTRAVCKMKTIITYRFTFEGVEMDNEADSLSFFLLERRQARWGVCFFTALFDWDKFVPVNPERTFRIPEEEVDRFPSGYRYLAWAEENIGWPPKLSMNSHGPEKNVLYGNCKDWLEGKAVAPDLTGAVIPGWKD